LQRQQRRRYVTRGKFVTPTESTTPAGGARTGDDTIVHSTTVVISVRGLVKKFGDFRALDGLDLKVREGEGRLYADLDSATAGLDLSSMMHALGVLSAGLLVGNAVGNRLATPKTRATKPAPAHPVTGGDPT
jgi:hypothetical protein